MRKKSEKKLVDSISIGIGNTKVIAISMLVMSNLTPLKVLASDLKPVTDVTNVLRQQDVQVSGIIKDESGIPLPGVNVVVKNTTIGVLSGLNGEFKLDVPPNNSELIVSYIGYKTQTIQIGNQRVFNIVLKEDNKVLNEVVVTAMGIERQSKSLTYTAQAINGNELTRAKDANLINSLQGKSAGLIITPNANGAGGSSKILLRGNKSITGNNNPLIVVDGVPMANNTNDNSAVIYGGGYDGGDALSTLNPDDVASISVLKGASAAALYGAVAANGVIMITTKKGNEGAIKIDFSSNMTLETVYNTPKLQNVYGAKIDKGATVPQNQSWGDKMENTAPDNIADFFRTGYNLNNTIALSGGSKNAQSYVSYGNTEAQGTLPNNTFMRHNFNARQNFQAFDKKLTFDFNTNYIYSRANNKPSGGMLNNPLVGLYVFPRNGNFSDFKNNYEVINKGEFYDDNYAYELPIQNWVEVEEHNQNPYWLLNRNTRKDVRSRFSLSGTVRYNIFDYLSVQGRMSYERDNNIYKSYTYASSYKNLMGSYNKSNSLYEQLYGDILVSFNKTVADFKISATIGTGFRDEKSSSIGFNGDGSQKYKEEEFIDSNGQIRKVITPGAYFPNHFRPSNYYQMGTSDGYARTRMNSVFGTAQVGYKDLAYVDFTARNDWSSTLAWTKNKHMSFFYPSVGVSVLVNEIFKMDESLFNLIKLRSSYSIVGNGLPPYIARSYWANSGLSVTLPESLQFTDLKAEKTKSIEGGFDLALFNNRFNMDFTYYKTNTTNQYFQIEAPWGTTYRHRYVNAGNIQNNGFETSLSYSWVFNEDWSWTPTVNFSYNDNKVKSLCEGLDEFLLADGGAVRMLLREGGSYGDIYTNELERDENGAIKLSNSGAPTFKTNRSVYAGNLNAKYRLGWSNSVRWKDMFLYVLIDGKIGGKVYSMTEAILDGYGVSKRSGDARLNGGIERGDGTLIDTRSYYSTVGGTTYNANFAGSEYIWDATNFRLRELSVGYTFRNLFGVNKDLTASLIGRNLFYIYKKAPVDPDISGSTGNGWQGIDSFNMPTTRSFGINVKMTF